ENALRNVMLTQRLVELLDCLQAAAIPVIPLKGPVLAILAYGDVTLRQFYDLDLLIARANVPHARDVLREAGYRALTPLEENGGADAALVAADYHEALVSDRDGTMLELHWGLGRHDAGARARADDGWAWRHAQKVAVLGRMVPALSWEAQLVYLCVHGSKHAWTQLGWIRDVAAVTRAAHSLDWDTAAHMARDLGAARMLTLGLWLAHELTGGTVPDRSPWPPSEERAARELAATIRTRLFTDEPLAMPELVRFQWHVRDRLRHRVGYGVELLTSPRLADVSIVSLPVGLRALYSVLRPLRLVTRHAVRLARSTPSRPATSDRRPATTDQRPTTAVKASTPETHPPPARS
ncbi:MAG: nucleotidyltransferase domain-containing protein, partial [Gemmatimonadaceae bacterium]